jgi:hypothetical protein
MVQMAAESSMFPLPCTICPSRISAPPCGSTRSGEKRVTFQKLMVLLITPICR